MGSNIFVVEANLNNEIHAREMMRLLRHYALDIMGGGENLSEYVQQNLVVKLKDRTGVIVLLAFEMEKAVGLAIAFEGFSTFYAMPLINIHDFVVEDASRGKGIARLMLEKLEDIAREKGCCKLTLEVLEGNERAQKVYKQFGFASYVLDPKMGRAIFLDKKIRNN